MGKQVDEMIGLLQASMAQTMKALAVLSDAELDDPSEHPCAMGGSVQDLLSHNIDHERMHVGQIYTARYNQRKMQFSRADRILAETLRARAELIAALIGLPDDALDARMAEDGWTIRQMLEHTIYWERHSIDELARTKLRGRVPADYDAARIDVRDPDFGELPKVE
jgi:uncharacterized damage-inducible protein DinB